MDVWILGPDGCRHRRDRPRRLGSPPPPLTRLTPGVSPGITLPAAKREQRIAQLKGELLAEIANLRGETVAAIARSQSTTVKWMFGFWAPTAVAIVGTGLGVLALLLRP